MAQAFPKLQTARSRSLLSTPRRLQTKPQRRLPEKGRRFRVRRRYRRNTLAGLTLQQETTSNVVLDQSSRRRHSFLSGEAFRGNPAPRGSRLSQIGQPGILANERLWGPRRGRGPPRSQGSQMRQRSEQQLKLSALTCLAQTSSTTTAPNASDHGGARSSSISAGSRRFCFGGHRSDVSR
jgi:hypothetical protein